MDRLCIVLFVSLFLLDIIRGSRQYYFDIYNKNDWDNYEISGSVPQLIKKHKKELSKCTEIIPIISDKICIEWNNNDGFKLKLSNKILWYNNDNHWTTIRNIKNKLSPSRRSLITNNIKEKCYNYHYSMICTQLNKRNNELNTYIVLKKNKKHIYNHYFGAHYNVYNNYNYYDNDYDYGYGYDNDLDIDEEKQQAILERATARAQQKVEDDIEHRLEAKLEKQMTDKLEKQLIDHAQGKNADEVENENDDQQAELEAENESSDLNKKDDEKKDKDKDVDGKESNKNDSIEKDHEGDGEYGNENDPEDNEEESGSNAWLENHREPHDSLSA